MDWSTRLRALLRPERRLVPWALATSATLIGIQIVFSIVSAMVVRSSVTPGVNGITLSAMFSRPTIIAIMLALACLLSILCLATYRFLTGRIQKRRCIELSSGGAAREFAGGLALGTLLVSIPVLVLWALGYYQIHGLGLPTTAWAGGYMGIAAAAFEELLTRGVLLRTLERYWGTGWALLASCTFFGAAHVFNPQIDLRTVITIGVEAGLLLGAAYLYSRRLWFSIGIHLAWNCVQSSLWSSPVSGTGQIRGIIDASFTGPDWLTGGQAGIEGSVLTVLVCLVATGILGNKALGAGSYLSLKQARAQRHQPIPSN